MKFKFLFIALLTSVLLFSQEEEEEEPKPFGAFTQFEVSVL